MRKLILHTVLILCALLAVRTAKSSQERKEIRSGSVDYVEMRQSGKEGKEIRLSSNQTEELTRQWNHARPIGLCKFYAKYLITVHGKNGEARSFRATEDTMKEENDYCFVVDDSYIESLWRSKQQ